MDFKKLSTINPRKYSCFKKYLNLNFVPKNGKVIDILITYGKFKRNLSVYNATKMTSNLGNKIVTFY